VKLYDFTVMPVFIKGIVSRQLEVCSLVSIDWSYVATPSGAIVRFPSKFHIELFYFVTVRDCFRLKEL
jgi:hypothetical protein